MKYDKKECPICRNMIGINNYKRHVSKCDGSYTVKQKNVMYRLDHDNLDCKFCNKSFKNKKSLVQHEIRCCENPSRKCYNNLVKFVEDNIKGKTKDTSKYIAKKCQTDKEKYENGYINPRNGEKRDVSYVHEEHNKIEMNKWFQYVKSVTVDIPQYSVSFQKSNGYSIVLGMGRQVNGNSRSMFEHDFIANIYLCGNLSPNNTVHHIDKNRCNNDIMNLIVFESSADHKRFHLSRFAFLVYDDTTHLFRCDLVEDAGVLELE